MTPQDRGRARFGYSPDDDHMPPTTISRPWVRVLALVWLGSVVGTALGVLWLAWAARDSVAGVLRALAEAVM